MTLPSSGSLSADQINTEFFDTYPVALSEYRGRAYSGGTLPSGQIAYSNFRGISSQYTIDFLVLAGGGGGGHGQGETVGDGAGVGGGGGAGGIRIFSFTVPNNNTTIPIVVGGGGNGASNRLVKGSNGAESSITLNGIRHNSVGGGGGGSAGTGASARPGANGGSGGGAGARFSNDTLNTNQVTFNGGAGISNPNQGTRGGNSYSRGRALRNPGAWGGGGGGAPFGGQPGSADKDASTDNPGCGGSGYNLDIFMGSANYRGVGNGIAGGGGGSKRGGGAVDQPSEPNKGGGGIGDGLFPPPTAGATSSGGGGGGSQGRLVNPQVPTSTFPGQNGGSGAVVIRYVDPGEGRTRGTGGTVLRANVGGVNYVFHVFTSTGNFTFTT